MERIKMSARYDGMNFPGIFQAFSRVINGTPYDFQRNYTPTGEVESLIAVNLKTGKFVHEFNFPRP